MEFQPPPRNPRRISSYNSLASQQIPKQYRVLGLASKASTLSNYTSTSCSTSTSTSASTTPTFKPLELSDYLSTLIKHITTYFNLYDRLPPTLLDRNLRMERQTDTVDEYHKLEIEFLSCLSGLRETLWSIQTQMKEENAFVRQIFRQFDYVVKKYLTRCLKGWKGMLMIRSCMRHYRAMSVIHRVLRRELSDIQEIMDAVGPHCKDMLLNVDVEVVLEWMIDLDRSKLVGENPEIGPDDADLETEGFPRKDSSTLGSFQALSPTASEKSMDRLFRHYRLPSFSSDRTAPRKTSDTSLSDGEMDHDFQAKKPQGRRSYLRASILNLN